MESLKLADKYIDIKTKTDIINFYLTKYKYQIFYINEENVNYIINNTGFTLKNLELLLFELLDKIAQEKFEDVVHHIPNKQFNITQVNIITIILYLNSIKVDNFMINVCCKYLMNKVNIMWNHKTSYITSLELGQIVDFIQLENKSVLTERLIETLTKMSEHYIFESTIVKIFVGIAYYFDNSYEFVRLVDSLSCKQLFALKQLSENMSIYLKLEKTNADFNLRLINDNFSDTFKSFSVEPVFYNNNHVEFITNKFLQAKIFIDINFDNKCKSNNINVSNLFIEELLSEDNLWYSFHLTQQGLNEIFESEQILDIELSILFKKNQEEKSFKLSRTWCRKAYRSYKKDCLKSEGQNCTQDKNIPQNLNIQKLIQRCDYQREEYAKVCVYDRDSGHDQFIKDLKKREETCQRIINSLRAKSLIKL